MTEWKLKTDHSSLGEYDGPDESVPEGVVGLSDAEGEEAVVALDPPRADAHRVPADLGREVRVRQPVPVRVKQVRVQQLVVLALKLRRGGVGGQPHGGRGGGGSEGR